MDNPSAKLPFSSFGSGGLKLLGMRTPAVVLTYAGWTRFNRDPEIIGKKIYHGRDGMTIIGIAPKNFKGAAFGFEPDVITHFDLNDDDRRRESRGFILLGRLRPGVSLE